MEINPSIEIRNLKGETIPITKLTTVCPHCNKKLEVDDQFRGIMEETGEKTTLKSICVEALLQTYRGEENLDLVKKLERGNLAEKIYASENNLDLPVEDIVLLKDLVGKNNITLFMMQAYKLLDPKPAKEKKVKVEIESK